MKAALVFLASFLIFVGTVSGYTAFTATFEVTNTNWNNGFYEGTLYYDWSRGFMYIQYPNTKSFSLLYEFNDNYGYNSDGLPGQFSYQYLYKSATTCSCEVSALSTPMPPFYEDSVWTAGGTSDNIQFNGKTCTKYSASETTYPTFTFRNIWLTDDDELCAFQEVGTTTSTFTITALTSTGSTDTSKFTAPSDCKCGKPIDVVLSLDRTGSISTTEWVEQYDFIQDMVDAFEYSSLKTNMGIINWNSNFWTTIELVDGDNLADIQTAVDAMGCCPKASTGCCCCGTPIGGGLSIAGVMMDSSNRPTATKVIILLTDGCQNHLYNATTKIVSSCNCNSEAKCKTNAECTGDITTNYNTVKTIIPSVTIIVVGVGSANGEICNDQLLLAAGGISSNVLNPQDWSELSDYITDIASLACSVDDTACADCCGLCICGTCTEPESCTSTDVCKENEIDDGCCTSTSISCDQGTDKCVTYSCTSGVGCTGTTKTCKDNTTCYHYYCNPTSGSCVSEYQQVCNVTEPECYFADNCTDSDLCTTDECINGTCVWTTITTCNSDACTTRECQAASGCVDIETITCDDKDVCTTDTCDTTVGCVFTNNSIPTSDDACKIPYCDPILGNLYRQLSCDDENADNCSFPTCENGSCTLYNICAFPPPSGTETINAVAIAAAVSSAALIGIILGLIAFVGALGGGGAYAYANAGGPAADAPVTNNPLYVANSTGGANPLHNPT